MNNDSVYSSEKFSIDMMIYFNNNTGIMLRVYDGHNEKASEIFELVLRELDVPNEKKNSYRSTFSLWLVSDLLELQLKPNHIPFKLVCFWEELLEKYVHSSEEDRQRDEPIILFQRNIYLKKDEEQKFLEPEILKLLFYEARKNVVGGRYPFTLETCEEMAVIQALVHKYEVLSTQNLNSQDEEKKVNIEIFDNNYGSSAYFLKYLKDYLPSRFCKRNRIFNRKNNPEFQLSQMFLEQDASQARTLTQLYLDYLTMARESVCYGGAFFRGQTENPNKLYDDCVWMCISDNCLSIINSSSQQLYCQIPSSKLHWQLAQSKKRRDANFLPCLFFLFPDEEQNKNINKIFQFFSRSAILGDNLIEQFVNSGRFNKEEKCTLFLNEEKVALAIFSKDGQKLKSTIRHHPSTKFDGNLYAKKPH